jgi:hypothetical protein
MIGPLGEGTIYFWSGKTIYEGAERRMYFILYYIKMDQRLKIGGDAVSM